MKTLTLKLCEQLGIPYTIIDFAAKRGPIWDGEKFLFESGEDYGDIGRFHELMHYLMADKWQLSEPDFGLGVNADADIDNSGRYDGSEQWLDAGYLSSWGDEQRVAREDAGRQENLSTYALALYSFIDPAQHAKVREVLDEFSAWNDEDPWTREDNVVIADVVSEALGWDRKRILAHLNKEMVRDHVYEYWV